MMVQLPRWSHTTLTMMRLQSLRCPYETATLLAFTQNTSLGGEDFSQFLCFTPNLIGGRWTLFSLIFRWVVQPPTRSFYQPLRWPLDWKAPWCHHEFIQLVTQNAGFYWFSLMKLRISSENLQVGGQLKEPFTQFACRLYISSNFLGSVG